MKNNNQKFLKKLDIFLLILFPIVSVVLSLSFGVKFSSIYIAIFWFAVFMVVFQNAVASQ